MIDYQPIIPHEPLIEPAIVRFRNVKTGEWIEGISEPQVNPNNCRLWLRVEARDPEGNLTGVREGPTNLLTNQFPAFVQSFLLATTPNTNPKRVSDGAATAISGANSAPTGRAGTNATAAAVTDFKLGTETETAAATVNANPTTGTTSGTFTITYTVTAGADRAYTEVGVTITNNTNLYLLCHDVFTALNVSNTGTLAVTYTWTNS